jgi:hypothetical protein
MMTATPIKCGADLPGGGKCDQVATVTNARYIYDRKPPVGEGSDELVLNEIHYSAICPHCGDRAIIERL